MVISFFGSDFLGDTITATTIIMMLKNITKTAPFQNYKISDSKKVSSVISK